MKISALLAAAGLLVASTAAQAFTVDFANIADTEGEAGYLSWARTFDGVELTATATTTASGSAQDAYAYFDSGNAGLGVCKVVTYSAQCNPSSDDNVTDKEFLKIAFDSQVTIDQIVFRNSNHGQTWNSGANFDVSIDGGSFNTYALAGLFDLDLVGSSFVFASDRFGTQSVNDQFYISALTAEGTPVVGTPISGTVGLIGLGLLGLVRLKRRA